jgi:hypothetical protein
MKGFSSINYAVLSAVNNVPPLQELCKNEDGLRLPRQLPEYSLLKTVAR